MTKEVIMMLCGIWLVFLGLYPTGKGEEQTPNLDIGLIPRRTDMDSPSIGGDNVYYRGLWINWDAERDDYRVAWCGTERRFQSLDEAMDWIEDLNREKGE